ncbi:endonuclease/exonuclease/phosphatase family protein [Rhodococcus ruber]|uniref:Endonuclease/exonuclease/phosphatase family protein n=1 Tax=Rhodococcus ruber TaxID=1830 RepID=A0ABT4MLE1_9NOCA|nr:endonuclease/exonuclease/phosphatase family protein [Rhodococcus ruber]MCZ4521820.1 endonuclease/exonuclease/phosphatase family protein [Rhodococcus ruber]
MKVISINAWGGARHDALIPWISEVDADIVCVQEVTRTPRGSGWATFSDGERTLPQRLNLFDDISSVLVGYRSHFIAHDAGPVTDRDGTRWRQDFGIATWVRDDFPIVGLDARFVHSEFVNHVDWTVEDRPRAALTVTVRDPSSSRIVSIVQLHGLRDPAGKHDTPARADQARRLSAIVEQMHSTSDVVALCGDLNLLPTSATFQVLGRQGMVDLVGEADTRTSLYRKPIRSASYFLISRVDSVRHFEVVQQPEVSDHRALLLEL